MKMYFRLVSFLVLSAIIASCGGGSGGSGLASGDNTNTGGDNGGGVTPSGYSVYAIDDYIIDATVSVYQLGASDLLFTTTTGDLGSFILPNTLSGVVKIEIKGGYEDIDGVAATTIDRKLFTKTLITLVNADDKNYCPVIVSALTTGIEAYAAGDFTKFQQAIDALPDDVKQLVDLSDVITNTISQKERFEMVKNITRISGFDSLSDELQDDGELNGSNGGLNAAILESTVQTIKKQGRLSPIKDPVLRMCVAATLQTEIESVTYNQLLLVTDLSCAGSGVTSVAGIDILDNLEYLNLASNDIADIAPLANLSKLSWLSLFDNRVTNIAPLNDGEFVGLGLNLEENCITDLSSINGNQRIVLAGYNQNTNKQYADCNKNGADLTLLRVWVTSTGLYKLLFRATDNSAAVCSIDWGDGQTETVSCDARPHSLSHSYAVSPSQPVVFKVNGVEAGRASYISSPAASLAITFTQPALDSLGATGSGYELITGNNGRPAAKFNGGSIIIPNRPEIQFTDGATFDVWARFDSNVGMNGWGSMVADTGWAMALMAKSHDRSGFVWLLHGYDPAASGTGFGLSTFVTFDPSWSTGGDTCQTLIRNPGVPVGQWFRVTGVASATTGLQMYVNKQLAVTCPDIHPSFAAGNTQDMYLGKYSDYWYPFNGAMQDLNIYQKALTDAEVQALP